MREILFFSFGRGLTHFRFDSVLAASVLIQKYEEKLPYPRILGNFCGVLIAVYVFLLLVEWQKTKEQEDLME